MELIRGSLVTVRHGTLQVIHLTVKEFLRSSHGPANLPYAELLINSDNASLQLTLVCLKCIAMGCGRQFLDLNSGINRTDLMLDPVFVSKHRIEFPLSEYASFSWMVHLTDCKQDSVLEVARAFQEIFNSPSTFCWVEMCLVFQPDSVLRLLVGLEELSD